MTFLTVLMPRMSFFIRICQFLESNLGINLSNLSIAKTFSLIYNQVTRCDKFRALGMICIKRREYTMTKNEKELINLIRKNEDPARAFTTALELILLFLKQDESSASTTLACPQERA